MSIDLGPSVQEIDRELRELSDATIERYARSGLVEDRREAMGSLAD
jgi:hypothetical protein